MPNLLNSLKASDAAILQGIAKYWGINISQLSNTEALEAIDRAMRDPEKAATVWEKLTDSERGVLQTLVGGIGANKGKMLNMMFTRMFGEIRKMGKGAIDREQPAQNPKSDAEALFYRGLIFEAFEQSSSGAQSVVYVPDDLIEALPTHKTAYDDLETEEYDEDSDIQSISLEPLDEEVIEHVQPADTTIVDDMTTMLAYLQIYRGTVDEHMLIDIDRSRIRDHAINVDDKRIQFLFHVGISADLISVQEDIAAPRRAEVRRWLESDRTAQLKALANAWSQSRIYLDLWHVEGLHPEPTGWPYDPVVAREAIIAFIRETAPQQGWWSLDDFIFMLKEVNPDFQRPNGDYDSWYIRNDDGEYLNGFESWDTIEGALLEFYFTGPMHWLGLVDLAEEAVRLTAFGRAFINNLAWPTLAEQDTKILVKDDGSLEVSRRVTRFDRFQAMRFTDWVSASTEGHTYRLNSEGIRRAAEQGITTEHIAAFINRMLDEGAAMPALVARLLNAWQSGPATSATIEQVTVLRTTAPETLDFITETPALRRYLGARLGPMAVIIRVDQWQALKDALGEHGIEVDMP